MKIQSLLASVALIAVAGTARAQVPHSFANQSGYVSAQQLDDNFLYSRTIVYPMDAPYNCAGNGVGDDTTCFQAALTAAAGGVLWGGNHLYKVGALTVPANTEILFPPGGGGIYSGTCTTGLVAKATNLTLVTLQNGGSANGGGSILRDLCINMGAGNTSGAAVSVGAGSGYKLQGIQINTPYIGVDVSGSGATQNTLTTIDKGVIYQPVAVGVRVGVNSTGGNTVDTRIIDTTVIEPSSNSAVGFLLLDAGGVYFRGNDAYQMGYGTKIFPGANQYVTGFFTDVLGDTSYTNDLLIDSNGGQWTDLVFSNSWASSALGTSVLIQNTGSGYVGTAKFLNHKTILNNSAPASIGFDIEAGTVSLQDSQVGSKAVASSSTAIKIGSGIKDVKIEGLISPSIICPNSSCGTAGNYGSVNIAVQVSGATLFSVSDNDLSGATTPLSYTPTSNGSDTAVIGSNVGVDNVNPSVSSASTITLPVNPIVVVTGVTTISTINGAWSNRKVTLYSPSGFSLTTGGNICSAATIAAGHSLDLLWLFGQSCWTHG